MLATPFRQGWVDAGGIKTRFVQAGSESNPPLVMLHGTAGSLENFAANIASHAQHFNCIAFDMIGSGMTAKPDYDYETEHYVKHAVDFFKAMDIRKASIIGLSLGARVASRFAIDHPEKVDKGYSAFCDRLLSGAACPERYQGIAICGGDESDMGQYP